MSKFKSLFLFGLFIVITFCLTGCVKFDVNITLDRNGNAHIEETDLINKDVISLAGDKFDPSNIDKLHEENPEINFEKYEEDDYIGYKATYIVKDVGKNDVIKKGSVFNDYVKTNSDNGNMINVSKGLFVTKYDIDWIVDFSVSPETGKRDTQFLNLIKSKLTINIPSKASENNATRVENNGHTYVWVYDTSTPENSIILKYSVLNVLNIIIALIILALLVLVTVLLIRRKAGNNVEESETKEDEE